MNDEPKMPPMPPTVEFFDLILLVIAGLTMEIFAKAGGTPWFILTGVCTAVFIAFVLNRAERRMRDAFWEGAAMAAERFHKQINTVIEKQNENAPRN